MRSLEHLKEDEVIKSALPDEMYKGISLHYKKDEWEKFLGATVTQWDLDEYT